MPAERIVQLPSSENFWSVGGPGPCGPDSEIYWDWGAEHGCGEPDCAPACPRCDRFLEFWNLVFMEFEQHPDGTLTPLPEQNIDTGMGLERTAAIIQDVRSVYETDAYQGIMAWVAAESGLAFGESERATKAHRVIADHGRGMTFLVGDGVMPSNEGRGYVLRRIIRRAVQQARSIGLDDLYRVTDVVVEQMADAYPDLGEQRKRIRDAVRVEEERFEETLARGMKLFEEIAARGDISGRDAFDLTATYGFPFELTRELALERGLAVDEDDFRARMEEHREISRSAPVRVVGDLGGADHRLRRLRPDGGADRAHGAERARRRAVRGEARALALLRGGRRPGRRRGLHRARGDRRARRAAARLACRRRPGAHVRRTSFGWRSLRRRRPRARGRALGRSLPDDGEPHRDPSPARVAPASAGRPRQAGRLGGAPGQAPLRLHARPGAHRGGARAGRGARKRADLRGQPRPCLRDAARRGAEARRPDAVRREVRRRRPRDRHRGLLARALRRHARTLDGRDRPVRDPLRGLGRRRCPADRGGDLRRGVRAAARAR